MAAFGSKKYDILHMVCHGELAPDNTGNVIFQDVKGKSREEISAGTLGGFLKDKELRLVFLSACNTAAGISQGIRGSREDAGTKRESRGRRQPI